MLRLFLGLNALIWLPYGLWCFAEPSFLAGAAGVAAQSTTASTELRAMYGGLQAAIGAIALAALLRAEFERPALLTLGFLCAGLALGRLGGIAIDGDPSSYTAGAISFEVVAASAAFALLYRQPSAV
jgi:hypothetical protein